MCLLLTLSLRIQTPDQYSMAWIVIDLSLSRDGSEIPLSIFGISFDRNYQFLKKKDIVDPSFSI